MARARNAVGGGRIRIEAEMLDVRKDDDAPELVAYAVGTGGKLLASAALKDVVAFPLDRVIWHCWLRFCTVRGTLLKRTLSGGIHIDLPVCDAESRSTRSIRSTSSGRRSRIS